MRILLVVIFVFHISSLFSQNQNNGMKYESIQWSLYSRLPFSQDNEKQPGLAGTFSGLINNKLVIAGGANFENIEGAKEVKRKYWSDVYILSIDDPNEWTMLPKALPKNLAYGVSITLSEGILFVGGSNEEGCHEDVFLLQLSGKDDNIEIIEWPPLPVSLSNMTGAMLDDKIYVAGGHEQIVNASSTNHFFSLDTKNKDAGWQSLAPWPGPSRSFASSAAQRNGFDNCFYLFSGINYGPDSAVEFLLDGYEYNTRLDTWKKIKPLQGPQFPILGSSGFSSGANHIVFVGGVGNKVMNELLALQKKQKTFLSRNAENSHEDSIRVINDKILQQLNHPFDFERHLLFYHIVTNTIVKSGEVPFSAPLTNNVVKSQSKIFIPAWDYEQGGVMSSIFVGEFLVRKTAIGWWSILIMTIYFSVLSWMGWYFSRRQENTTDYFKAGGKMSWWVVALSIYGTSLSSITYMSIPAKAYATDWSYLIYSFGMIISLPVIILLFIPFYRKLNIITAYEYLEMRFNVATRVLASVAFIIFQIGRMAIVLFLPAIAINILTGFDIFLCIALMGFITLLYTTMGGIEAVIWTDAVQVMILFGGAFYALVLISTGVDDGLLGVVSTGSTDNKFSLADTSLDLKKPTLITALLATFFANLTTYGTDQTMVQRYMTTRTEKMAVQSVWGKLLLALPGSFLFFLIGTGLYAYYKSNPSALSFTITDGDAIFPWFIFTQMPEPLSAILLSGILAACMSTVSSSINSAATAYSVDIHFRFGWIKHVRELNIARFASIFFGLVGTFLALMMATWEIVSLWDQFIKILGLLMGSFGGLFLLGLLTRRANGAGAIIGICASILVQIWVDQNQVVHVLLYVAVGSLTCFIVGYLASLLMPKDKKDISNLTIAKASNQN